jgi:hypothetical protein
MTKDFDNDALYYLLDEMDAPQRLAFEDKLTRFPGARVALHNCADLLRALRHQALDFPFFGEIVSEQLALVTQPPAAGRRAGPQRYSGIQGTVGQFVVECL